ncbi:hypothetical protein [Pandoravirus japonicus]|uniref:Uncharacterized protein n=1 Tax=Pandoravirus japonicus TaxID=2823154 RepID=A0A811BP21_9VIRU|nr:hypothetical protein [Pandoravirus japonicus]
MGATLGAHADKTCARVDARSAPRTAAEPAHHGAVAVDRHDDTEIETVAGATAHDKRGRAVDANRGALALDADGRPRQRRLLAVERQTPHLDRLAVDVARHNKDVTVTPRRVQYRREPLVARRHVHIRAATCEPGTGRLWADATCHIIIAACFRSGRTTW